MIAKQKLSQNLASLKIFMGKILINEKRVQLIVGLIAVYPLHYRPCAFYPQHFKNVQPDTLHFHNVHFTPK